MSKKPWPALLAVILLSGCVSIELPHLVSDTVKAGKDVIDSVSSKKESPATGDGKGIVFSNTVLADPGAVSDATEAQCLTELESQAKEKLGRNQLAYKVVSKQVSQKGGKQVATCSLEIL